jgi:hypothetical protein
MIAKAMDYLADICRVRLARRTGPWPHVLKLNRIRNCIVHQEAHVGKEDKYLADTVAKTRGVRVGRHGYLVVEEEYVVATIGRVRELLDAMYLRAYPLRR